MKPHVLIQMKKQGPQDDPQHWPEEYYDSTNGVDVGVAKTFVERGLARYVEDKGGKQPAKSSSKKPTKELIDA